MLNLTPPTVFDRTGVEGFELTAEGNALLRAQQRSTEVLSGAIRETDALRRGMAGSVTLGAVSTGKYFANL